MPTAIITSVVADPSRLAALERLGILDTPAEDAFDRLTRMATRVLRCPIALVTIVDGDRQFFKSAVGLPEPWASRRETPLTHSFCQHAVESREPLIVEDARAHPLLAGNLAIRDLGVVAYAGVPMLSAAGVEIGTFCAIDTAPRVWSYDDEAMLRDLAMMAVVLIEYRAAQTVSEPPTPPEHQALDRAAAELLAAHGGEVYRLAVAVTGSEADADHAVAEGLYRTLRGAPGQSATKARFAVQTRACALERCREGHPASMLAALQQEERCAVELACYARLSAGEIASELGMPRSAVLRAISAGMGALRGVPR